MESASLSAIYYEVHYGKRFVELPWILNSTELRLVSDTVPSDQRIQGPRLSSSVSNPYEMEAMGIPRAASKDSVPKDSGTPVCSGRKLCQRILRGQDQLREVTVRSGISEIGRKGIAFRSLRRASHIQKTLGTHAEMESEFSEKQAKGDSVLDPRKPGEGERSVWGVHCLLSCIGSGAYLLRCAQQANGEGKRNCSCEIWRTAAYYCRWQSESSSRLAERPTLASLEMQ